MFIWPQGCECSEWTTTENTTARPNDHNNTMKFKCPAAPSAWGAQQLEREFGSEEVFSTQKSRYMNGLETWQQREQENVRKCIANKTAQFSLSQNVITPTRECWPSPYNLFMLEYFGFWRGPVTLHWWWPQPQLYGCTSNAPPRRAPSQETIDFSEG